MNFNRMKSYEDNVYAEERHTKDFRGIRVTTKKVQYADVDIVTMDHIAHSIKDQFLKSGQTGNIFLERFLVNSTTGNEQESWLTDSFAEKLDCLITHPTLKTPYWFVSDFDKLNKFIKEHPEHTKERMLGKAAQHGNQEQGRLFDQAKGFIVSTKVLLQHKDEYGFKFIESRGEYDKEGWIEQGRPCLSITEKAFILGREHRDRCEVLTAKLAEFTNPRLPDTASPLCLSAMLSRRSVQTTFGPSASNLA